MLVALSDRPEFALVGMKCKIKLPTKWIGSNSNEKETLCPAYIKKKVGDTIWINVLYSPKYKNSSIKYMQCHNRDWDVIFVDVHKID